jgi:hypothetical protein
MNTKTTATNTPDTIAHTPAIKPKRKRQKKGALHIVGIAKPFT